MADGETPKAQPDRMVSLPHPQIRAPLCLRAPLHTNKKSSHCHTDNIVWRDASLFARLQVPLQVEHGA